MYVYHLDTCRLALARSRAAYYKIPAASLKHILHPQETLGRGLGTNIAVDAKSAQVIFFLFFIFFFT